MTKLCARRQGSVSRANELGRNYGGTIKIRLTCMESLASLRREPEGGWHSLRKVFATEVKGLPLPDDCPSGGWKEPSFECSARASNTEPTD